MIRSALLLVIACAASQAQAGQEVPPPRPIRPVQPALIAAPSPAAYGAMPALWRDTPPVIEGWSPDRRIPVVAWIDEDAGYADDADDFGEDVGDDGYSSWGDM